MVKQIPVNELVLHYTVPGKHDNQLLIINSKWDMYMVLF